MEEDWGMTARGSSGVDGPGEGLVVLALEMEFELGLRVL